MHTLKRHLTDDERTTKVVITRDRNSDILRSNDFSCFLAIVLLIALLFLSACTLSAAPPPPPTETVTPSPVPPTEPPTYTAQAFELLPTATREPTRTPIPYGLVGTMQPTPEIPGSLPSNVDPLTGQWVSDPSLLDRRPLVIKITNFPRGMRTHQYGLNTADHVWEYYLEDELTRFIGVFYGRDAQRVGPVRSARPFDEHLLRMYKGILTFGYADDRLMDQWVADKEVAPYMVIEKPGNCPPMCRIGPKTDYNTLYTDTAQLSQYVTKRGTSNSRQSLDGLRFDSSDQPAAGGQPATRIEIRFSMMSYNYWEYQPATRRYLRWQDADRLPLGEEVYQPLIDALDKTQVATDNIILLQVATGYVYVSNSTEVHQHYLEGSGEGFAVRDGRIFEITWKREQPHDLVTLWLPNGNPYVLKPGNVWYEVLSPETLFTNEAEVWRFVYSFPPAPTVTPKFTYTPTPYK